MRTEGNRDTQRMELTQASYLHVRMGGFVLRHQRSERGKLGSLNINNFASTSDKLVVVGPTVVGEGQHKVTFVGTAPDEEHSVHHSTALKESLGVFTVQCIMEPKGGSNQS